MPKGPKGEKRPADVVGAAVMVAKIAMGEVEDAVEDDGKDKAPSRHIYRRTHLNRFIDSLNGSSETAVLAGGRSGYPPGLLPGVAAGEPAPPLNIRNGLNFPSCHARTFHDSACVIPV
jgi:hypothetical protein